MLSDAVLGSQLDHSSDDVTPMNPGNSGDGENVNERRVLVSVNKSAEGVERLAPLFCWVLNELRKFSEEMPLGFCRRGNGKMFEYLKDFKYRYPDRKLFSLTRLIRAVQELSRAVKQGRYVTTPVLRKYIPKADGRMRPLGIPIVKDRVLQQAARNVIEGIFEMKFLDCSYGFRPERSAHQAIAAIEQSLKEGNCYVLNADIKSFFDSVNHGVMEDRKVSATTDGTPQRGVISPLLANIYLHELDRAISKIPGLTLVRYADDFVILCNCKWRAQYALEQVKQVLSTLHLELHPEKTRIVNASIETFEFLGFQFGVKRGHLRKDPRARSVKKFKESVIKLTRRNQPIDPKEMVGRLNLTIRGWGHYFKIGNVTTLFTGLDVWIRMRVRSFIEKRKSRLSHERIPNHALQAEYKLASLITLLPRSLLRGQH